MDYSRRLVVWWCWCGASPFIRRVSEAGDRQIIEALQLLLPLFKRTHHPAQNTKLHSIHEIHIKAPASSYIPVHNRPSPTHCFRRVSGLSLTRQLPRRHALITIYIDHRHTGESHCSYPISEQRGPRCHCKSEL